MAEWNEEVFTKAQTAPLAIAAALQKRGATSQEAQAKALGIGRPLWNKYIKGRMSPSIDRVAAWCARLNIKLTFDPRKGWLAEGGDDANT